MKKYLLSLSVLCLFNITAITQDTFVYNVGDVKVVLLSEGQQEGNTSIIIGATDEILKETAPDGTFPNAVNAFLIEKDGNKILVDTGYGRKLFSNLQSLGIKAEDVDKILLTHMHGDHIGGMLRNGKKAFPNGQVFISEKEYSYWKNENNPGVKNVLELYTANIILFDPAEIGEKIEIMPGIYALTAHGHTPGHTAFMIESEGEQLLIWGDLTHAMAIQMPYPQVSVTYDVDPDMARELRIAILKYAADNNIPVAGMHIAYPAIGNIRDNGNEGYEFRYINNL